MEAKQIIKRYDLAYGKKGTVDTRYREVFEYVMPDRNQRKTRVGVVVSDKSDKTIIVKVQRQVAHSKYDKIIRCNKKYSAHDEKNDCNTGDTVKIMETRPLSKTKRWRLCQVISKVE